MKLTIAAVSLPNSGPGNITGVMLNNDHTQHKWEKLTHRLQKIQYCKICNCTKETFKSPGGFPQTKYMLVTGIIHFNAPSCLPKQVKKTIQFNLWDL